MSTWGFSPSQNVFYPMEMQADYEAAGSWPPDIVEVDDAIANEYRGTPPAGKVRGVVDGMPAWVDIVIPPAEAYSTALNTLRVNGINAAQAIQVPYSFEEAATWWVQAQEAAAWTADNNFIPPMLTEMVAASNGGWTLPSLAANIVANSQAWKEASGNILGQLKTKRAALLAIKAQVDAGTAPVSSITNFDCTITIPAINIADKFA